MDRWVKTCASETGVSAEIVQTLFHRYGTLARKIAPTIAATDAARLQHATDVYVGEVVYCIQQEKALRLSDFLLRRSSLAFRGLVTEALLVELSAVFSAELNWSDAERQSAVMQTKQLLQTKHRMRL